MNKSVVPFTTDQIKLLSDAGEHYEKWIEAARMQRKYSLWMGWRKKKGSEYLTSSEPGGFGQKSLGKRSAETEAILDHHLSNKTRAVDALRSAKVSILQRAPLLKAVKLNRVPVPLANLIRELDIQNLLGHPFLIGGSHALAAYEVLAGATLPVLKTKSQNLNLIYVCGTGARGKLEDTPLLDHFRAMGDSYFVSSEDSSVVEGAKGVQVKITSSSRTSGEGPLIPKLFKGQEWLTAAQALVLVGIDSSGFPVRLAVPDPRVFALHKAWLARQVSRDPSAAKADLLQAVAVAYLLVTYLPQFPLDGRFLRGIDIKLKDAHAKLIPPLLRHLALVRTTSRDPSSQKIERAQKGYVVDGHHLWLKPSGQVFERKADANEYMKDLKLVGFEETTVQAWPRA